MAGLDFVTLGLLPHLRSATVGLPFTKHDHQAKNGSYDEGLGNGRPPGI